MSLESLKKRINDLDASIIRDPEPAVSVRTELQIVAERLATAREKGSARIMMMGGHVVRSGVQRYIIDLMRRGLVACLAVNGAVVIHDYEFAIAGATTESVARYIRDGRFGMWTETGRINDIVRQGAEEGLGLGEAVGRFLCRKGVHEARNSIVAAAYDLGVPVTVHVGIGQDIIHQHPNCDGAAFGKTSYTDFLIYTEQLRKLEGGVVMNFGSAVMGPETYLKALSMVRNAVRRHGEEIRDFTTLVCDLQPLPENYDIEAPKSDPFYYFRPWKTMLVRTTADGGQSIYVRGRHEHTVPELWTAATRID